MSFGKRGMATSAVAGERGSALSRQPDLSREHKTRIVVPRAVRQLASIAGTIVFFVACMNIVPAVLYFGVVPAIDRAGEPASVHLDVSPPAGGYADRDLAVQRACLPERLLKRHPRYAATLTSSNELVISVEASTHYLACVMSTDPMRYCDPFQRRQLAANLATYFAQKAAYLAFFDTMASRQGGQPVAGIRGTSIWKELVAKTTDVNAAAVGASFKITEDTHPAMITALLGLAADGLLSADDFGWLAPAPQEIAPLLFDDKTSRVCT